MPKHIMVEAIWFISSPARYLSPKYHRLTSSNPRPTTLMPITVPLEKAVRRPALRLLQQALTVRPLLEVAMRIPIKPASPEKSPPVRKANGV